MKPPIDFSLPSALRILLPGFFVATATFPLVDAVLRSFEADGIKIAIDRPVIWALVIPLVGYLFVIADMHIYMLFEGRRYWPAWLREGMMAGERSRLSRLSATMDKYQTIDRRKYLEAGVEIRRFKMDESGEYMAEFPTRLGNLLAAFEDYPKRVYGMDAVFYWPRIWVALDKDLRAEVDGQQAFADSTLYTAFALVICGVMSLFYAASAWVGVAWLPSLKNGLLLLVLSAISFIAAYVVYRGSLHLQASFGETFKSVFDVFRHLISFDEIAEEISTIVGGSDNGDISKREKYRIVWRYLHNYRVKLKADADPVSPEKAREMTKK